MSYVSILAFLLYNDLYVIIFQLLIFELAKYC